MVGESCVYGKCTASNFLLFFSLFDIKMHVKLKYVQVSFLISATTQDSVAFIVLSNTILHHSAFLFLVKN